MAKVELEAQILRKGREADRFEFTGNLDDNAALQRDLVRWLQGNGWSRGLWAEFEMILRPAGQTRVLKKIRVPL